MKIAAAQIACTVGDVSANLQKIRDFAARARENGAELMVFPEMADTGYVMRVIREQASPWTTGAVPELQKIAKTLSLAIICGVSERDGDRIYNSQIVITASGEIDGKYRKTHLFSPAPIEEDKCFVAGDCTASFPLAGFHLGLSICYDLRFPEVFRKMAIEAGVDVFVISSAWPFPRVDHFRTLAIARAIENQSYVVAANRVGTDDGVTFCGSSLVIDPYGIIVASASSDREELVQVEIYDAVIQSVRENMPVFAHRRPIFTPGYLPLPSKGED